MPLTFTVDKTGTAVEDPNPIEIEIDYADLDIDAERAPEELAARILAALGTKVEDEEGIFDLVVSDGGDVVAALVLDCEEDALALAGERTKKVTDEQLAEAVIETFRRR